MTLSSFDCSPETISSISFLIEIRASMNLYDNINYCRNKYSKKIETHRSISSLDSDSVGSINQQVEMGH